MNVSPVNCLIIYVSVLNFSTQLAGHVESQIIQRDVSKLWAHSRHSAAITKRKRMRVRRQPTTGAAEKGPDV